MATAQQISDAITAVGKLSTDLTDLHDKQTKADASKAQADADTAALAGATSNVQADTTAASAALTAIGFTLVPTAPAGAPATPHT